jgi:arsenical pump membrane protein
VSTVLAVALLLAVLAFAVVRPRGLPEVTAAAPAALLAVVLGLVSWADAWHEVGTLGPTVGFLAAILVLAQLADEDGVFGYAGRLAARAGRGSPVRLLTVVFGIAATITAVLSLDATVVLLTPVVLVTATNLGVPPKPHTYACTHLANSASLPLPISNLTNLLAFAACGLSFATFAGVMVLPWLAVIGVEYLVFRRFFVRDLSGAVQDEPAEPGRPPVYALVVLAATLVGFGVLEPLGVAPAWVALAGAAALAVPRLRRRPLRRTVPRELRRLVLAANAPFCLFVFALGIVVLAVRSTGLGGLVTRLAPEHATLLGLLGTAVLAAVLANLLNNLPATLVLVPVVAHSPGLVLAVLLGVNIGPNLTYVGSLATLLWRQILHARDYPPRTSEFLALGALTVPAGLLVSSVALWLGLRLAGV